MTSIIGIEAYYKPIPRIIEENRELFRECRNVLEIGAGRGRFVRFFLENYGNIEEYVAIEPYEKSVKELRKIGDPRLTIVHATWEDVREKYLDKKFDIVVFWDVLMFMDLSFHGNNTVENAKKELDKIVNIADKYFLFSLHPVKRCILGKQHFKEILGYLDKHPKLKLIAKKYLNRLYKVIEK